MPDAHLPVARVAVDSGLAHLDRPFDYAVPDGVPAVPGCRVKVRFAGRQVAGIVLDRVVSSEHPGRLSPLTLVNPEPVATPEVLALCRAVADRHAGALWDVLRLALPPRQARVEAEPPANGPWPRPPAPDAGPWARYPTGRGFLEALVRGGAPRAVWSALPGPTWPHEVALAVQACLAGGRGAVIVVPDARDAARVSAALDGSSSVVVDSSDGAHPSALAPRLAHVELRADLGPTRRYRAFLAARRGEVRVVVGTRAAAYAPVENLGLVVLWDDGDDLHAEPRSPYAHVRDVLVQRAHLTGAAALLAGFARTAEGQLLVDTGWARPLTAAREQVRLVAPRVVGTTSDDLARDPAAQSARLPGLAFEAARRALADDAPVLVQVPRRGYAPALACQRDGTQARCTVCAGPLAVTSGHAIAACRWCGHLAGDWRCPVCGRRELRATVVGSRRTAEELGRAFPGVVVRTSGREEVLSRVDAGPSLVVCTPGAEPVADGGYGAVLLLDAWALLGRADLRAGEEALRRWFNACALARPAPTGRVVVVADVGIAAVQALVRWDPAGAAVRELADRVELGFPPAARLAAVDGPAGVLSEVAGSLDGFDLLGPVPHGGAQRLLVRAPLERSAALAAALARVQAGRSLRKEPGVRVELDPQQLG